MYLFQISNYDDPAVERETAELLHQHLEAESRRRCPLCGMRQTASELTPQKARRTKSGQCAAAFMACSCWLWAF